MPISDVTPYLTPRKLGRPVLTGSGLAGAFDERAVDCPFVFEHGGAFMMMYIGFDGRGYQTGMARSTDLLNWEKLGTVLKRGEGHAWDRENAAGTWLLCENDLDGPRTLKQWQGRYWMAYHSYPGEGYEVGPAQVGLAWTEDESLMTWHRLPDPVLTPQDGAPWEAGGLYKECLIEHQGTFYLYYNAKDRGAPWTEQIGLATSRDLAKWERFAGSPVVRVTPGAWDSRFCSDPCVVRHGGEWVMFFFGFDGHQAQEGIAVSTDMLHWDKHPEPILTVGMEGALDSTHAHKPAVISHSDILYHFYCACRPSQPGDPALNDGNEFRCVTVAMGGEGEAALGSSREHTVLNRCRRCAGTRAATGEMLPRERMLAAINHLPVDRIPTDIWATPEVWAALHAHFGPGVDPLAALHIDGMKGIGPAYIGPQLPAVGRDETVDYWGIVRRQTRYETGVYDEQVVAPLAFAKTVDDLHQYCWPSADWFDYSTMRAQAEVARETHVVQFGYMAPFYFHNLLRGLEQSLIDPLEDPELTHEILRRISGFFYEHHRRAFEACEGLIDVAQVTDDLGSQTGPLISMRMYETFYAPHHQRFIDLCHEFGIKVFHHDDGSCRLFLPRLVAMGIDILNPIQWTCPGMDRVELQRAFGDVICFHGGVDNQRILPFGTPEDVRAEVRTCIDTLAPSGTGYIVAPCHNLQPVTPIANILAMYDEAWRYGRRQPMEIE